MKIRFWLLMYPHQMTDPVQLPKERKERMG